MERRTAAELDVTMRAVTTTSESRSSVPVHKSRGYIGAAPPVNVSLVNADHNRFGGPPAAGDYGVT